MTYVRERSQKDLRCEELVAKRHRLSMEDACLIRSSYVMPSQAEVVTEVLEHIYKFVY